jgi:putative methionine-R-sulfoxide reductase with GAF domain
VVGVLDVESERLNAFTDEDKEVLERVALLIGQTMR